MTEPKEALEPCPFCGAHLHPAKEVSHPRSGLAKMHPGTIDDGDCPLSGWGFYMEQLAAWNTRADATENAALREKLAERKWKPIETAPRDHTTVHVISTKWLEPVPAYFVSRDYLEREYGDANYMDAGWYPSNEFLFDLPEVRLDPTHWMPLPEPPALTGCDNAEG